MLAWLLVCSVVVHLAQTGAPRLTSEELEADLDRFVPTLISCRDLAGVSISAVSGQEVLVAKGYGYADLDTKSNVTEQTLFGIASLSKAFTATLLGKMLTTSPEGYTWDTSLRAILGEDFYLHDADRTLSATVRDLLTHRMGYLSYNNIRHQSGLDRQTLLQKVRFLEPIIPFRHQFYYNNIMYGLLTYVTEVIGGDTWENLVRRHIFKPLNMTSSTFTHEIDLKREDLAKSYKLDSNGTLRQVSPEYHSYWGKIGGSGSVVTSALDMTKWLKVLLNEGRDEEGNDVIPSDVIKETHTPFETIPVTSSDTPYLRPEAPVSFTHFNYGLGWRIGFYRGWRTIHHTGSSMGYLAKITLVPDLSIGVFTSLTGEDPGYTCRRHLHLHTLDLLMGERPWLNETTACTMMSQGRKQANSRLQNGRDVIPEDDLTRYVGTYGNFAYGNVTFYVNGSGHLYLSYGDLGLWEMIQISEDHHFDAIGVGHVWNWVFSDIAFGYSQEGATGPFDQVIMYGLEPANPPLFRRDLKMSNAPPPPDLTCTGVSHVSSVQDTCITVAFAVLLTLMTPQ